jgi:hypothetical protein
MVGPYMKVTADRFKKVSFQVQGGLYFLNYEALALDLDDMYFTIG